MGQVDGNTDEPEQNGTDGRRFALLAAAVVAGAALAWGLAPRLFNTFPTDMVRTSVLLDAMRDADTRAPVVVFGNSVAMNAVDGRQLSRLLPGNPVVLNLASTGQTPFESYLYYQELPADTRVVVQIINPEVVASDSELHPTKYNGFYMFGYRPDERTRERMSSILGEEMSELFAKSDFTQRFESRWTVHQVAEFYLRQIVREDIDNDRATYDLRYPASGADRLPDRLFARALQRRYEGQSSVLNINPENEAFLAEMGDRVRDQGRDYVLVAMPMHPGRTEYRNRDFYTELIEYLRAFADEHDIVFIDGMDTLRDEHFSDALHPDETGAELFTAWLGGRLTQLRDNGRIDF